MEFHVNHPILFVIVGVVILAVLGQSVFFLVRAWRRANQLGMDKTKLKKTVTTAAIFTIAPAVAILVGVISLSHSLGVALPWLRLSVVGSLSYETVAAGSALEALGMGLETQITDPSAFVTVLWVMTIGILAGVILTPAFAKKIQGGMGKLERMDKKWAEIFNNALFLGMISAFLGYVFCDFSRLWAPVEGFSPTSGLIPVCVMVTSALVMVICGLLMRKPKFKWLGEYALPISLVVGMAAAIPFTGWLS